MQAHTQGGVRGIQTPPFGSGGGKKKNMFSFMLVRIVGDLRGYPYPVYGKLEQKFAIV